MLKTCFMKEKGSKIYFAPTGPNIVVRTCVIALDFENLKRNNTW